MLQVGAESVSLGWEHFLIHLVLPVSTGIGSGMSIQSKRRETKGEVGRGDAAALASQAPGGEEGSPAPGSSPWKTLIDQAPLTFGLVVSFQCSCSDGKLTNNKSKQCFQTVQKSRISKQAFSRYLKFSELFLSWVLRC